MEGDKRAIRLPYTSFVLSKHHWGEIMERCYCSSRQSAHSNTFCRLHIRDAKQHFRCRRAQFKIPSVSASVANQAWFFFFFVVVVRLQNTQLVLGAGRSLLIVLCQLRQVSIIAGEHADTRGTTPARVKIVSNSDNVCWSKYFALCVLSVHFFLFFKVSLVFFCWRSHV